MMVGVLVCPPPEMMAVVAPVLAHETSSATSSISCPIPATFSASQPLFAVVQRSGLILQPLAHVKSSTFHIGQNDAWC